jgi:hypothetical protein
MVPSMEEWKAGMTVPWKADRKVPSRAVSKVDRKVQPMEELTEQRKVQQMAA